MKNGEKLPDGRIVQVCMRPACGNVQVIRPWKDREMWTCTSCGKIQGIKGGF